MRLFPARAADATRSVVPALALAGGVWVIVGSTQGSGGNGTIAVGSALLVAAGLWIGTAWLQRNRRRKAFNAHSEYVMASAMIVGGWAAIAAFPVAWQLNDWNSKSQLRTREDPVEIALLALLAAAGLLTVGVGVFGLVDQARSARERRGDRNPTTGATGASAPELSQDPNGQAG